MRLTSQLFAYPWQGSGNNCNSYCISGEQLVLIDPGHERNEFGEPCIDHLINALASDGLSAEKIDLILLTHSHPDHSEAAMLIKEKSGAKIAMHPAEREHWFIMNRLLKGDKAEPKGCPVADILLEEGELPIGKSSQAKLQVLHTPGHSPGSLAYYWPADKALIAGDVVFPAGVGRTDFPQGDSDQLKESIERLAELDTEYLLPGHLQIIKGSEAVKNNFQMVMAVYFMFL